MKIIITIALIALVLIFNEIWWRRKNIHSELSRKFVHITVGSFVAFWPFFLSFRQIELLSLAFLVVVLISKYLNIFSAIHSVQRPTWGEIYFALAVGGVAFIATNKWIFMAALLQMSLADGFAALVGTKYAKRGKYSVFGHTKSVIGSFAFFVTSLAILLAYTLFAPNVEFEISYLILSAGLMVLENISFYGLDNLVVPVVTAVVLRSI